MDSCSSNPPVPPFPFLLLLVPLLALAHMILFRGVPKLAHFVLIMTSTSVLLSQLFGGKLVESLVIPSEISASASSFVLGLMSNLYSRKTGNPSYTILLSGLILQVPGSFALKSSIAGFGYIKLQDGAVSDSVGMGVAIEMVVISISISLGLLLSQ